MSNISIDVRKKTVQELINEEIPSGRYWLPSFQRNYVWDSENVKELIDSIIKNYPIGATILWKPSPQMAEEIDPTSSPMKDDLPINKVDRYFVIDGQQRITSLLLLFNSWSLPRGGDNIECDRIAFDLARKRFVISRKLGIDLSRIVKAFCLHDVEELSALKREINDQDFNYIRLMSQKILDYPIPQYIMETSNEDELIFSHMAESFVRINKEGIRIGNAELMLSFMAGTLSGSLKQRVSKLNLELEKKFDVAIQPIIRFVFSNFGLSQTQLAKPKQFSANITKIRSLEATEIDERLKASEQAINLAVKFLNENLGINSARLLPSQTTIIPLATYFKVKSIKSLAELSPAEIRKIESWLILTNLNGHYSASVDTRLNRDINIIQTEKEEFPFKKLLEVMKVRKRIDLEFVADGLDRSMVREANKAFTFLLYVLLTKNQADDWGGQFLITRKREDLQLHHIFPREYLRREFELDDVEDPTEVEVFTNNLANMTFIQDEINASISDVPPSEYLKDYIGRARLHFIPADEKFWSKEAYENSDFQHERINLIFNAAKKFFPDVFAKQTKKS